MSPHVLVVDSAVPADVIEGLRCDFVVHEWGAVARDGSLPDGVRDAVRGVVTTWQRGFDAELIRALPRLEVISVYGTGEQKTFDLAAAKARKIVVANTGNDGTDACVADLTIGLLLCLARRIGEADSFVRRRQWLRGPYPLGVNVSGKRAGIIGLGYIGRQIARRLQAFDMRIAYSDVSPQPQCEYRFFGDAAALAHESDFLIASCRGGAETTGLIDARVLDALGPEGLYIHVSQARIYDEAALIRALRDRAIAGAAIDIFENEPQINEAFYDLPNVLLSPHVGTATHELIRRRSQIAVDNLKAYFSGRQLSSRFA